MKTEHLNSLYRLLDNERERLSRTTCNKEIEIRTVFVQGYLKEIEWELNILFGKNEIDINDDDLLKELL